MYMRIKSSNKIKLDSILSAHNVKCKVTKGRQILSGHLNLNYATTLLDKIRLLIKNKNIDILVVNETKIDDKVEDQHIAIDDYSRKRYDRNRNRGGIALYVISDLGRNFLTNLLSSFVSRWSLKSHFHISSLGGIGPQIVQFLVLNSWKKI